MHKPPCVAATVSLLHYQSVALQAFCFARMAAQGPQPSLSEDKYVALVSGLGLGDDAGDPLKLSLLVDYLVGSLASNEEQTRVSKVPLQISLCMQCQPTATKPCMVTKTCSRHT